ncbi:hypothetical protein Cgig2_026481 [Carnegiea gigantea]|uniref:RNA polymerase sigma-70 domain-containing protein n=1 Tax=Carnegiea gigantea TaxID=171969 RepID=A0A9Q1KGP0_9CARY|nr:hypothetical protein Cgig2_026481 [Carnegiea gigantea]
MTCLLPQFKCQPYTFSISSKLHPLPSPTSSPPLRTRDSVCFRTQCPLSASSSTSNVETAVLDIGKLHLPYVEANSSSLLAYGSLTYLNPEGSPTEAKFDVTLAAKMPIEMEEAVVAAAAAEALALARAAAKLARDAALMASSSLSSKAKSKSEVLSEGQSLRFKSVQLLESEQFGGVGTTKIADTSLRERCHILYTISDHDGLDPTNEELQLLEAELAESIAVKSTRQVERKAKRERAAEKAASNVTIKSGSNSRRRRTSVPEVNHSDPLHFLLGATSRCKLLTASEEVELSAGIQDLLKLQMLHQELQEKCGGEPSFAQWAAAAGVDQITLRKRLTHGIFCKDKMIRSNMRLVISIAKKYQGTGMNLLDLVQQGCRGLSRGAEKFDGSKGFSLIIVLVMQCHMVQATYKVKQATKQLYCKKGRQPDNEEVAEAAGLSMKKLNAVLMTPKAPWSLDQRFGDHKSPRPSETIAHPGEQTLEDVLIKQIMKEDLNKVLDTLGTRAKRVIQCRFGLEDGRRKTLLEIGKMMGVSRERIRQIELKAFRQLQNEKKIKDMERYFLP